MFRPFLWLGGVVLLGALVAGDLWLLTRRSLEGHERRIGEVFDGLRARHASQESPLQDWEIYPAELESLNTYHAGRHWPCRGIYSVLVPSCGVVRAALDLNRRGVFFPYEARPSRSPENLDWYQGRKYRESIRGPVNAWEWDLVSLALLYDAFRAGGLQRAELRLQSERAIQRDIRQQMSLTRSPEDDLAEVAGRLDRLRAVRPRLRDAIAAHAALERRTVLSVLREGSDPDHFVGARPRWKDFFSWHVFLLRILNALEAESGALQAATELPPGDRIPEVRRLLAERDRDRPNWTRSLLLEQFQGVVEDDEGVDREWRILRLDLAKAWFQAERGVPPASPEALVPKYIAAIPADTGRGPRLTKRPRF